MPAEIAPSATHKALRPVPSSSLDGWWPPEQAYIFFKGLRGCTALKTLRCYGDASSPKQRSALRAIHPHNAPKLYPLAWGVITHLSDASAWGAMPHVGCSGEFPPSAAMVVMVFCSLPEQEPLLPVEPRHSGYRQKALVSSKTILALYWGKDVEIKEKRREIGNKYLAPM